ncbi:hypothetical protein WN944_017178 [Citrus x changshan-huyou]|uniref:Uncharacterized protein n=1 Tax=Citrus x changshan-huyou TaxID=2935761 RepID=A0AAP0MAU4_9ROSI
MDIRAQNVSYQHKPLSSGYAIPTSVQNVVMSPNKHSTSKIVLAEITLVTLTPRKQGQNRNLMYQKT